MRAVNVKPSGPMDSTVRVGVPAMAMSSRPMASTSAWGYVSFTAS